MKKSKILYFDDEVATAKSLVNNLCNNFNYDITFVANIADFLSNLKDGKFGLLMIDVMAPIPYDLANGVLTSSDLKTMEQEGGLNIGLVLADKIWKMDGFNDIPIIFLTAKGDVTLPPGKNCRLIRKPELAKHISNVISELLKGE